MMIKNNILILVLAFISVNLSGQEELSLNQAIKKALENNRNIKISKNSVIISENLAGYGQAGMLPTLNASGLIDYGNDNYKTQAIGSNTTVETNGVESMLYNASVNFNYTIFSGFANKRTYEKLKTNIQLTDANSKVYIENIIMQVAANYYNVVRTEENYRTLVKTIDISKKRYELAKANNEFSGGTKLALLNAEVDLNKDSASLYDAIIAMESAKLALNKIIGDSLEQAYSYSNTFTSSNNYNYDSLKQKMNSLNYELVASKYNEQVSMLDYKIAKSSYYPSLNLSSSYSYSKSDADNNGFDLYETNGLGTSLSLNIPIYSGGVKKTAVKNAKIIMENYALESEELKLQLEMELLNAFKDYKNSLLKVKMEKSNVETATLNFELSEENYKLGQINSTDFRLAQLNLLIAENSYNNSLYNAELAELEILKLSGVLLSQ